MELKQTAKASAARKRGSMGIESASDCMPGSQSTEPLQPFGASGKATPNSRVPGRAMGGRVGKFTGGAAGGTGRMEKAAHAKHERGESKATEKAEHGAGK